MGATDPAALAAAPPPYGASQRLAPYPSAQATDPSIAHRAGTRQWARWDMTDWLASQPSGNLAGTLRWTGSVGGWASRSSGMPARATTMQAWRWRVVRTHRRPASRWKAVASRRPDRGCSTMVT